MQNPVSLCPRCQAPIPPDAPGGICPGCALLGVMGPATGLPDALRGAPTLEEVSAAFPELEVIELIGHGGMGIVFKARQPRLDRLVALKILPLHLAAQPGFSERFTREARALARLSHPHIVAVYDFGESGGFFFLQMEFVDGVNLRQAIRAGVTPEQALALVPRLCEALQFAHDKGVLHRDIKPENILLDQTGAVKLADFGIAKMAGESASAPGLTASGSVLGTAAYMAPEQLEKPESVDHRADIYSLGVVFYEMLTGELPIGRFAPPSEKSTVHRGVDEVVFRALEKERDRRQQSATEMRTQVEGVGAWREPQAPAAPLNLWPHRLFWLMIGILVLPLVAIFAGLLLPRLTMISNDLGARPDGWVPMLVALLPFVTGGALFFGYRRTRPGPESTIPGTPWNPWPKRIFLLLLGLIILPTLLIGLGVALPYALARRPVPSAPAASSRRLTVEQIVTTAQPPFVAHFQQGSIELVSISEHPSTGAPGWQMDGSRATEGPFANEGTKAYPQNGQWARELVFRTKDLPDDAGSPNFQFDDAASWSGGGTPLLAGKPRDFLTGYHLVAATFPTSMRTAKVRAGISMGPWKTITESMGTGSFGTSANRDGANWDILFGSAIESKDGRTIISATAAAQLDWDVRMIAATTDGREVTASRVSTINAQSEWSFEAVPLASVRAFAFQARRVHWAEFQDVALLPAAPR